MTRTKKSPLARRLGVWQRKKARSKFFWPVLALSAVLIVLDQVTKFWTLGWACTKRGFDVSNCPAGAQIPVSEIFNFTFVQNKGVSFGMRLPGEEMVSRVGFSLLSALVVLGLIYWLAKIRNKVAAIGVGFIISGALGNLIDRIAYGWVVDFFDFSQIGFPWVFNVADMAINVGVACLAYDAFFGENSAPTAKNEAVS